MIAAAVDLEVGAAGERCLHADDDLSRTRNGHRNPLDTQIFSAVKHSGRHFLNHHFHFFRPATVSFGFPQRPAR